MPNTPIAPDLYHKVDEAVAANRIIVLSQLSGRTSWSFLVSLLSAYGNASALPIKTLGWTIDKSVTHVVFEGLSKNVEYK
jgi:hypothetical protein